MYRIIERKDLASAIKLMTVEAPEIARKAEAGQFIILRLHQHGERIPLTIADFNRTNGTITIVFQVVGKSTEELAMLQENDYILNFVGPLGMPSELAQYGHVICIGGGVGIAPIYPIARSLQQAGNKVTSIIGARSRELLFFVKEMDKISEELHLVTDDGSGGRKGLVTDVIREIIQSGREINLVFAIGPVPMMSAVARLTKEHGIKTVVSLNPVMVDGTGMCGGCRVSVAGTSKFACVDGPDFDAHQVDFNQLQMRQRMFLQEEQKAREYRHLCTCGRSANE